jgi:hypothetical protein
MLCSEYPCYHGSYWQTDWPSTLGYRTTFKDSTDTIIQQVQFTDSSGKARRKRTVDRQYANEQSDTLLDRPLSDKVLPHVTYSQPIQLRSAHILCLATDVIRISPYLGSVVKLSIFRGRTCINWPSNSRDWYIIHLLKDDPQKPQQEKTPPYWNMTLW